MVIIYQSNLIYPYYRWEEEKKDDGVKWTFLEHKGPVFAPPYEPLPKDVKFYYDGEFIYIISLGGKSGIYYGSCTTLHQESFMMVFINSLQK